MMRCACTLAEKYGVQSISSGESIGQVASQTMEGLIVSTDCADRPVFRPLIAMDKGDIMDIAKEIGTYVLQYYHMKIVVQYLCQNILKLSHN